MSNANGIRIHGGIALRGKDAEIHNLELEQLLVDPEGEDLGTIWYNDTLGRVSYNETEGLGAVVRRIVHDGDITQLASQTTSNINVAVNAASASILSQTNAAIDAALLLVTQNLVTNNTIEDIVFGTPVYFLSDGSIAPASAANSSMKNVIGFVNSAVILANGGSGNIQTTGILAGTVNQWNAITGNVNGLIPNKNYFLSLYSGRITTTIPDGALPDEWVCAVGKSLSKTELSIKIDRPIGL